MTLYCLFGVRSDTGKQTRLGETQQIRHRVGIKCLLLFIYFSRFVAEIFVCGSRSGYEQFQGKIKCDSGSLIFSNVLNNEWLNERIYSLDIQFILLIIY